MAKQSRAHGGAEVSDSLYRKRHSAAHLTAEVILEEFPDAKIAIGPPVEHGFYYDFELPRALNEDDLASLEKKVKSKIKSGGRFEYTEVNGDQAKVIFAAQPYKLELIEKMLSSGADEYGDVNDNATHSGNTSGDENKKTNGDETGVSANEKSIDGGASNQLVISTYKHGNFEDLCRGPHVENIKDIDPRAFKLSHTSGAYWRGDETRPMLQRVYGLLFDTKEELEHHLWQIEEAKRRDHRRIGEDMDLFAFSDEIGRGLPLWLPKGATIREELEAWAKQTERKWGYERVASPHITKDELYYISGHLPYYEDDLYSPMKIEDETYYLKPMNCPHHHMIFKARPHSYRDLPLRYTEYGTVYRYEKSGQLHGLMRVRGLSQNDAHIYCTEDQAKSEFLKVMQLHEYYYKTLGIEDFYMVLALRDPNNTNKYHGDEQMWQKAESITREVMDESKIPYVEEIGGAAHYGPKVDFIIRAVTGKEFSISTNQVDLYMPARFGLKYTASDGSDQTPVVIHRAPLGSHERFVGFLIEHYAGAFPAWLAPEQVRIIPITDDQVEYCKSLEIQMLDRDIRVKVDSSSDRMQAKIRNATMEKVPYILVVGRKEEEVGAVALRLRTGEDHGAKPFAEVLELIAKAISSKSTELV